MDITRESIGMSQTAWAMIEQRIRADGLNPGNPNDMIIALKAVLAAEFEDTTRDAVIRMSMVVRIADLFRSNFFIHKKNKFTVIK